MNIKFSVEKAIVFCFLVLLGNFMFAQVPTDIPIELRAQFNGKFDYKIIGNTLTSNDNTLTTSADCQFLEESSANLTLEDNQTIVAAYLYWSGIGDGLFDPEVELNGNSLFADEINVVDPVQNNFSFFFGSFKNVTDLVLVEGEGLYTFSNLNLNPIIASYCGSSSENSGWAMLVIYEEATLPTRQVNVYDGFVSVFGFEDNATTTIEIGGLNVVNVDDARVGFLAWNGSDNFFFNEFITFNGNLLSNTPLNPIDNPFNGTNSYTGATDLWNMDLDFFDISNFIEVGDTDATITFGSGPRRFIQNVVTVIRSELPDATVSIANFTNPSQCNQLDISIETTVSNLNASDVLPTNTPVSFFVLDENGDEVFINTFFTQTQLAIDASETQFLDITIPSGIPANTTLIVKVNTLADGSNPINESNILNNVFEQEITLLLSPDPLLVENLENCAASIVESFFNLENAFLETPNPEDEISFHFSLAEAENNQNPITNPTNYNPSNSTESIFLRRFNGSCFSVSEFAIDTLQTPQITAPTSLSECDTSTAQDGFAEFDLNSSINEITGGNSNLAVDFFLTETEAQDLTIPNGLASPYTNENAFSQTLFVRVTDSNTGCVSFTELELEVETIVLTALAIDSISPSVEVSETIYKVCLGDEITFVAGEVFLDNDLAAAYTWSINGEAFSGQSVSTTFTEAELVEVTLVVENQLCAGYSDSITVFLQVGTEPDFGGTGTVANFVCAGDVFQLIGAAQPVPFEGACTPPVSGTTFLPDGSGVSYETCITVDCFTNNQVITSASDLVNVFANIEHSFTSDLDISITSPDGTEVFLFTQAGGGSNFGIPAPGFGTEPGIGFDYFWTESAAATMADSFSGFNQSLPAGDYLPVGNFSDFIGDSLNGDWCITVTDNLFIDNGYIFEWALNFDTDLVPEDAVYEPIITDSYWLGFEGQGDVVNVSENTPGEYCYTYVVEDDFGCTHEEIVCVEVFEVPELQNLEDLIACGTEDLPIPAYDLTQNDSEAIGNQDPALVEVSYYESETNAASGTGQITNPETFIPVTVPFTIHVRIEGENGLCFELGTFILDIQNLNNDGVLVNLEECSFPDGDFGLFDLTENEINALDGNDPLEFNVQYFLSEEDALDNTNPITNPESYQNTSNPQTIFVRVGSTGDDADFCFATYDFSIEALPTPVIATPENIPALEQCDDDQTGVQTLNLTSQSPFILNGLDPTDYQIQYHTTQLDAENDTNEIVDPTNFTSAGQSIFVRVTETDTTCFSFTSFEVIINPIPPLQAGEVNQICDFNNDGLEEFFLPFAESSIIADATGFSFQYFENITDAENNTNAITNPNTYTNTETPTQTLFVLATNDETGCQNIQSITIEVLEIPQIIAPEIFAECDFSEEQAGFTQFDLTSTIAEITGGNTNYQIEFFTTQAEAEDLTILTGLASPYTNENAFSQTLFVRATDSNNGCVAFTELELQIDLLPVIADAENIPDLEQCDDDENGVETLDLTSQAVFILNGLPETDHQIQYYTTQADAENDINEILDPTAFVSSGQTIFVRVTEIETGCFSFTSFEIIVNPIPPLQPGETNFVCDLNNDGLAVFFLPFALNSIIDDPAGYTFQYFESLTDAENNTNEILDPNNFTNTQGPTQTLYVLATDDETGCQNIQSIEIVVVPADFLPFALVDLEVCAASLDGIGIEIDLTEQDQFIFGDTDPSIYTVTYHLSQFDAAAGSNTIPNPEAFLTVENPQEIWVRIVNNIINCVEIGSFDYEILLAPVLVQPEDIPTFEQCPNEENSPIQDWDLLSTIPFFYDTPELADISFHASTEDAENDVNPLPTDFQNTENPQTIFVRAEAIANGCAEFTSFTLLVNTIDTTFLPEILESCDTNNDGFVSDFDLQTILNNYANNFPEIDLSFHLTESDAENQMNPISSPYANVNINQQEIYAYAFNNFTGCEIIFDLGLFVRPSPLLNEIDPIIECDTAETGIQFFDLTQVEDNLFVPGQDTTDFVITYHLSEDAALNNTGLIGNPEAFQNTSSPQTVYIRVSDPASPLGCFNIEPIELIVDPLPEITPPTLIAECDDIESGSDVDEVASFDLTQKVPEITNNDTALDVFFYATEEDQANDNPIINVEEYQNIVNPQTIEVSVFSPNTDCVATTTLTLVVDPLPTIPAPEPLIVCDADNEGTSEFDLLAAVEDILDGEVNTQITFHLTEVDANNADNPIVIEDENGESILFQNFNPFTQTLYIRAENIGNANINGTGCFTIRPLELQVVESPRIEELEDLVICDDESLNGFAPFDLVQNTANAIGEQTSETLEVTYHISQADAELGLNEISVPSNYTNITNPQTIYVRLFDTETECVDLFGFADDNSFTITVEPYPDLITPTPLEVCNTTANPEASFPTGIFDLTSKQEELTGLSPVPGNISFTYYESEEDLLNQESPIENPEEYINSAAPPMLIYVEATNTSTENQCSNTSTITLSVLPLPFPVELTEEELRLTACDEDNDGIAADPFDLTQIGQQITGSENNVGSYYLTEDAAINEDIAQQIADPTAYVNEPALNELDEDFFPTNTQIVWVRLDSNAVGNFCFVTVPIELIVEPNPELNPAGIPFGYTLCEGEPTQLPTVEEIVFSLYDVTNGSPNEIILVLDPANTAQDPADYEYSLHLTEAEAEAGTNPVAVGYEATDGEILYLRVTHLITECYNIGNIPEVQITIEPRPEITDTDLSPIVVCADEQLNDADQAENQEVATIDLTQRDAEIDPNFEDPDSNTLVEYYASEEDLNNGIPIEDPTNFTTTQTPTTIFAQVIDLDNFCSSFTSQSFEIQVNPLPLIDISQFDGLIVCINPQTGEVIETDFSPPVIDTGLSEDFYSFEWTLNGTPIAFTGSAYTVDGPGIYTVTVTDITNNQTSCQASSSAEIIQSNGPSFEVNVLSLAFDGSHSVEVTNIQGDGDYEFQVDNGPWRSLAEGETSLIFTGLDAGERVVRGRDLGGCGEVEIIVSLIDYPRFFTPNEDGYNDTWNIIGLANQVNAKIYIFDRYGKLLKQISPSGQGWDGTYNGKVMVGNDYWFRVEYDEPANGARKEFKANFTLKR